MNWICLLGQVHKQKPTLTVVSPSIADLESRQVVKEELEVKGRKSRFKSLLVFIKPVKKEKSKRVIYLIFAKRPAGLYQNFNFECSDLSNKF